MPQGAVPGAGATIAGLEQITGGKLELLAGKPSSLTLHRILEKPGSSAETCLMTGDRLATDIRMSQEAGMHTAVILTGVTRREDLAGIPVRPDFILDSLSEILKKIE